MISSTFYIQVVPLCQPPQLLCMLYDSAVYRGSNMYAQQQNSHANNLRLHLHMWLISKTQTPITLQWPSHNPVLHRPHQSTKCAIIQRWSWLQDTYWRLDTGYAVSTWCWRDAWKSGFCYSGATFQWWSQEASSESPTKWADYWQSFWRTMSWV